MHHFAFIPIHCNAILTAAAAAAAAQSALLEVKVSSTSNSLVMHTSLPPLCLHCSFSLELLPWLHAPCLSCTYNSVAVCITCGIALHQACFCACCLSCASLMMFIALLNSACEIACYWAPCSCPGRSGDAPLQCDLSLLVTVQAAFMNLFLAKASSWSVFRSSVSNHRTQLRRAGHEPVCLVPGQLLAYACLDSSNQH